MMSEKRFRVNDLVKFDYSEIGEYVDEEHTDRPLRNDEVCDLLNEQEQKIQKWKNLYELKDSEVTARVDTLNRVCEYYTSETRFKGDTDPNDAVKEAINEILNAPIYEE